MESNERLTFDEVANSESLSLFQVGSLSSLRCVSKRVKHVLTHRIIWADYYILESDSDYCPEDFFYTKSIDSYAVPVLLKQLRAFLK